MSCRSRAWAMVVCLGGLLLAHRAAAAEPSPVVSGPPCGIEDGRMPNSVQFTGLLKESLEEMLSRSDGFRGQCERLSLHPSVYVRLKLAPAPLPNAFHARTFIVHTLEGPIIAYIEIDPRSSWPEWIAHEIEHVLEQADGVRLFDLMRQHHSWESSESTYETQRAIDAGRIVSREMWQTKKTRRLAGE
jgi:hypothetical protein